MTQPLVSVIVPVYNTGKEASKLVDLFLSIYDNIEIVLVDDGSEDDSLKLLQEKQKQNKKVFVYTKKNGGASSARNFGIDKATGEYILFMDSDDEVEKSYVKKLVAAITKKGVDLAMAGKLYRRLATGHEKALFVNPLDPQREDETFKNYVLRLLNSDGRIYAVNDKIFRADIIKNNHLKFEENVTFAEDTRFVLNYLSNIEGRIEFIYEPLYIYNFGTETSTVSNSSLEWKNWVSTYEFVKKWVGEPATKTEQKGLKKLKTRWKISHALAVARSTKKFSEKTKYLNPLLLIPSQIIVKFRR